MMSLVQSTHTCASRYPRAHCAQALLYWRFSADLMTWLFVKVKKSDPCAQLALDQPFRRTNEPEDRKPHGSTSDKFAPSE